MTRLITEGWEYPRDGRYPLEGTTVETVDSGGVHRLLIYESRHWFFTDRSAYTYFTPQAWRLIVREEATA